MGWPLAAGLPSTAVSDHSITVALIAALGTVVVALIGLGAAALSRSARTSESPPIPDAHLGERVAVLADRDETDRRTLAHLDRHIDGIGDQVDKLRWEMDDLQAWREQHNRRHGQ